MVINLFVFEYPKLRKIFSITTSFKSHKTVEKIQKVKLIKNQCGLTKNFNWPQLNFLPCICETCHWMIIFFLLKAFKYKKVDYRIPVNFSQFQNLVLVRLRALLQRYNKLMNAAANLKWIRWRKCSIDLTNRHSKVDLL